MPTNLPAEAKKKWNDATMARNPREKTRLLQEFLSLIPKHKGTERLRAQVKTKISSLRREMEEKKQKRVGGKRGGFFVEKEGAAQIVILGKTNVGRSSLLAALTHAKVEISNYPFTTREPVPGMLQFGDLQFQFVEAPALIEGAAEGKGMGQKTLAIARNADALILMVDLLRDPSKQLSLILSELEKGRIYTSKPSANVEIEKTHMGTGLRIVVIGKLLDCTTKEVQTTLRSYRVNNAVVRIYGQATLDDVEEAIFENAIFRPTLIIANKSDVAGARKRLADLRDSNRDRLKVIPVSCKTEVGLKKIGEKIFEVLDVVKVYTKEPREKNPSKAPFILKRGATIAELAKQIHSDFLDRFSFAKVWSERLQFSPQKVGLSFVLENKDVVELHLR
ncbi:MAG: 50S ribosome-binding GTPase [Candidatus Bathyarchaeota archaeon]|nr:MAG: 50S ribosome-binding GTPase [Candidatus Bathyarchaeota archaeon]